MELCEIKERLLREYSHRIEMHAHTSPGSLCGRMPVPEVIDAYAEMGYDGIVITNHLMPDYATCMRGHSVEEGVSLYLGDYRRAVELGARRGMTVLLGAEIRFSENENDYLVYGVDEPMLIDIYRRLWDGVERFRKEYPLPRSVFLQAHPFRNGMVEVDPSLLDGIEVFNMHPEHLSRNAVACRYAAEKGLGILAAGSDFHHPAARGFSTAAIRTREMPRDSFELAEILKNKDYLMEIGGRVAAFP